MKTYWVDITLAVDAMHEESADNKLDSFLSAVDQKKNDKLDLISVSEFYEEGESPEDGNTEASDYDEEWDDLSWEDLDDGADPEKATEDDGVEDDEAEDEAEDDEVENEEVENEEVDELDAVLSTINSEESDDGDDDDDDDFDDGWGDFDEDWED